MRGGALAAVAAAAVVTVYATRAGESSAQQVTRLVTDHRGQPVTVNLSRTLAGLGDSHVAPGAVDLSLMDLGELNTMSTTDPGYRSWFRTHGAIDAEQTRIQLVVSGNRDHPVRVMDLHPVIDRCTEPLAGTLFYSPSAGVEGQTLLTVNLDKPGAAPSFTTSDASGNITGGQDFFAAHTVSLARGEQYTFRIDATTAARSCSFGLALTVLDGTTTVTERVADGDRPFQVTALRRGADGKGIAFAAYQRLFLGGVANAGQGHQVNAHGDPAWIPVDPGAYRDATS